MCKIIALFLVVCLMHNASSYASDPLENAIINGKQEKSASAQQINLAINALGREIGSAISSFKIRLATIQREGGRTSCGRQAIAKANLIYNQFGDLEQCRLGNQFNSVRNTHLNEMGRQLDLAQKYKQQCNTSGDYISCANEKAKEINDVIAKEAEAIDEKVADLSDAGNQCIVENKNHIEGQVKDVENFWNNC